MSCQAKQLIALSCTCLPSVLCVLLFGHSESSFPRAGDRAHGMLTLGVHQQINRHQTENHEQTSGRCANAGSNREETKTEAVKEREREREQQINIDARIFLSATLTHSISMCVCLQFAFCLIVLGVFCSLFSSLPLSFYHSLRCETGESSCELLSFRPVVVRSDCLVRVRLRPSVRQAERFRQFDPAESRGGVGFHVGDEECQRIGHQGGRRSERRGDAVLSGAGVQRRSAGQRSVQRCVQSRNYGDSAIR